MWQRTASLILEAPMIRLLSGAASDALCKVADADHEARAKIREGFKVSIYASRTSR